MSQEEVFKALKALGGKANGGEIKKKLEQMYPGRSVSRNVTLYLKRLAKYNIVKRIDKGDGYRSSWEIVRDLDQYTETEAGYA
jgi:hypothetical protein